MVANLADLLGNVTVSPSAASQPENYFGTVPCCKVKARRNGYRAAPFAGSLFACFCSPRVLEHLAAVVRRRQLVLHGTC